MVTRVLGRLLWLVGFWTVLALSVATGLTIGALLHDWLSR